LSADYLFALDDLMIVAGLLLLLFSSEFFLGVLLAATGLLIHLFEVGFF